MADGAYCVAFYSVSTDTNNAAIGTRNAKWIPTWATAYSFA